MPQADDYVVEIRDSNFARIGQLAPEYTDLKFVDVHNGVGTWELNLPADHPLLANARAKGAGIIVTNRVTGRIFSGRMRAAKLSQNAGDPEGTWTISGSDDNLIAAASLAYPDPANLATAQTAANWVQSGAGETVMKMAVQQNIGSAAIASRKYPWLVMAADSHRGATVGCSPRFDVMGDLLTSLGTAANLGWRFYQTGSTVTFDVYTPQDKRGTVRLDVRNGGLDSDELGYTAPGATQVLVLGQGEGVDRKIRVVTSAPTDTEATNWGIRWETALDQRNTNDDTELDQAGNETLTASGSTINTLKVTPSDAPGMALGTDWYVGDRITVVVAGVETDALVTQVATSITSAGVIQQATVGDPTAFDYDAKVGATLSDHEERIGNVETLIGTGTAWSAITGTPSVFPPDPTSPVVNMAGMVQMTAAAAAPTGWLLCRGQSVLRTDYPALFAAIGTTYGSVDGTHFNVPNMLGRAVVGQDTTQTEFAALGQSGGAKTHAHNIDPANASAAVMLDASHTWVTRGGPAWSTTAGNTQTGVTWSGSGTSTSASGVKVQGTTDAASTLQPYIALNYIIKT